MCYDEIWLYPKHRPLISRSLAAEAKHFNVEIHFKSKYQKLLQKWRQHKQYSYCFQVKLDCIEIGAEGSPCRLAMMYHSAPNIALIESGFKHLLILEPLKSSTFHCTTILSSKFILFRLVPSRENLSSTVYITPCLDEYWKN